MENLILLDENEILEINGGEKEWVLFFVVSPVLASFSISYYLTYNS